MFLFWKRTGSRAPPLEAFLEDPETAAEGCSPAAEEWEPIEKRKAVI